MLCLPPPPNILYRPCYFCPQCSALLCGQVNAYLPFRTQLQWHCIHKAFSNSFQSKLLCMFLCFCCLSCPLPCYHTALYSFLLWVGKLHVLRFYFYTFSSVAHSCLTLRYPHGPQHVRPPCPSPTPRVYSNSSPLSRWCHPTISSSVVPFCSCLQSLPASGSFQMSQLFALGGQCPGVSASASVLPMNTQDWSPLGWTGWISLPCKGLTRVFSNTIQKHQFFGTQLSL